MKIDKKELSRLSPEERIKKLRLMEDERKKESTEIERLIKEAMQEIKTDKIAEEIAPEQRAVDISRLFEVGGEELEKTIQSEQSLRAKGKGEYQAFVRVYQDYSSLKKIAGYAEMGSLSQEHLESVDAIGERLDRTKYEHISAEIANIIVASRATLHKIRKYSGI